MFRKIRDRLIPDADTLRQHPMLLRFGQRVQHSPIWHLSRRSASRGMLIGMFFAFLPLPFRTVPVVFLCIGARANLPLAIGCTWLVNPLVMGPVFYMAYKVGAALLDIPVYNDDIVFDAQWMADRLADIWEPLVLGSLVCASAVAAASYTLTDLLWRRHTLRRWRNRPAARLR